MTRRRFIYRLLAAAPATALAASCLRRRRNARLKYIRAVPLSRYPGPLRPLWNVTSSAKWSG